MNILSLANNSISVLDADYGFYNIRKLDLSYNIISQLGFTFVKEVHGVEELTMNGIVSRWQMGKTGWNLIHVHRNRDVLKRDVM